MMSFSCFHDDEDVALGQIGAVPLNCPQGFVFIQCEHNKDNVI